MNAKHEIDPAAAFPQASHPPEGADLVAVLGGAAAPIVTFLAELHRLQPGVTEEWKYSDRSGWYRIYLLKKRRLVYLIPKRDDFRLSMILGGKALALLKAGPFGQRTAALLKTAQRYPEGTLFTLDRRAFAADLPAALVIAKLAP